jgi:hypothetical protein
MSPKPLHAANAGRWTKLQTVAWIAFRTYAAVCKATELEATVAWQEAAGELKAPQKPTLTAFAALEAAAVLGDFRDASDQRDARAQVSAAERLLDDARQSGRLRERDGLYRSADVRAVFPSAEGRGKGQRARTPAFPGWKLRHLGMLFLTTHRNMNRYKLFLWCQDEGLTASMIQYGRLRREALKWAQNKLLVNRRWDASLSNMHAPMTEAEFQECEQNLRSWSKVGRPRKPPDRLR